MKLLYPWINKQTNKNQTQYFICKILFLIESEYDMVDYMDITVIDSPYSLLFTSSVDFYHIQYVNVIFSIGFLCE